MKPIASGKPVEVLRRLNQDLLESNEGDAELLMAEYSIMTSKRVF